MSKNIIEVIVGFDLTREEIAYINSGFYDKKEAYKDPAKYTAMLLEMAHDKWLREYVGIFCPECDEQMNEGWQFCPNCGWGEKNE